MIDGQMLRKIGFELFAITTLIGLTLSHNESGQGYYGPGMMWSDGSWMHNGAHMAGYNMWGLGWFGFIPGLLIWILVIFGIAYLYQIITENRGDQ